MGAKVKCKKLSLLINSLLIATSLSYALPALADSSPQQKPIVHVLTWWGYFDYQWVNPLIENTCHVAINYDEYQFDSQFLNKLHQSPNAYDILVFEDVLYPQIKSEISFANSDLYQNALQYNPIVKHQYQISNYDKNVAYFDQAVSMFMWNPMQMTIKPSDSLETIFKKASNSVVVLMDDPIAFETLMKLNANDPHLKLTEQGFKHLTENDQVYITNEYNEVYTQMNFAFSYLWSGDVIYDGIASNINFPSIIHPKLSYVSSDLIAQLNDKPGVACVAKLVSSPEFLNRLQNDTYYFSPYTNINEVNDEKFKAVYQQYLAKLPSLIWVSSLPVQNLPTLLPIWKSISLSYGIL